MIVEPLQLADFPISNVVHDMPTTVGAGLTIAHQRDGCGRKNTAEGQILCHLSQIRRVSHEFFR
ncbi:hypothetical protein, partial [Bifidobacterium bifidum]|uniref:hypothetical protein n=1 Tax=Bifidobacterium bifidum TaxID=1681 RepID=UPI0034A20845